VTLKKFISHCLPELRKFLNYLLDYFVDGRGAKLTRSLQLMFIVKDDHLDVPYTIAPAEALDAEGNVIADADLIYAVTSDNPAVVEVTPNPEDAKNGNVRFGSPGLANINVTVSFGETLLGSFGAQFTVTTGDPASISGGSISFDGLTES